MKELNYENYKKEIDTLYDYLEFDNNGRDVTPDIKNGYLTINEGKDGQDYLYYLDESKDVALNIATGKIITNKDELESLFY